MCCRPQRHTQVPPSPLKDSPTLRKQLAPHVTSSVDAVLHFSKSFLDLCRVKGGPLSRPKVPDRTCQSASESIKTALAVALFQNVTKKKKKRKRFNLKERGTDGARQVWRRPTVTRSHTPWVMVPQRSHTEREKETKKRKKKHLATTKMERLTRRSGSDRMSPGTTTTTTGGSNVSWLRTSQHNGRDITMAPVASWSLVDYQQHPPIRQTMQSYGRLRQPPGSNPSSSLKSYGSVSSFESDPYASLMSVQQHPPNKPPRAQPSQPPSTRFNSAAANRSKSHSDLVSFFAQQRFFPFFILFPLEKKESVGGRDGWMRNGSRNFTCGGIRWRSAAFLVLDEKVARHVLIRSCPRNCF